MILISSNVPDEMLSMSIDSVTFPQVGPGLDGGGLGVAAEVPLGACEFGDRTCIEVVCVLREDPKAACLCSAEASR